MRVSLAGSAALSALVFALYGGVLRLWWIRDDFYALRLLRDRPLGSYWTEPGIWRSSGLFTPLLLTSFDLDLGLFGLHPKAFYLHQLLAACAAAIALFAVLRLWLAPGPALLAASLFVLGAPVGAWVDEILVRHYAEGLVLAAASTGAFVLALRRERPTLAALSSLFYLGAMLEKEVYAPMPALLLLLPESTPRRRFAALLPHAAAALAYAGWRHRLVGTFGGGYGWLIRPDELPRTLAALPGRILGAILGSSPAANAALVLVLAAGVAAALWRSWRSAGLFAAAVALAALTVFPVSKAFQLRYAGLAWLAGAVAFAFGCARIARRARGAAMALAACALLAALAVNRGAWRPRLGLAERMSAEGLAFCRMGPGETLRAPAVPPAAMKELARFKEDRLRLPSGARWFDDDLYVCRGRLGADRLLGWVAAERAVRDVTFRVPEIRARCGAAREAALSADFSYRAGDLLWELGPYRSGEWAFVLDDGVERIGVDPRGGYRNAAPSLSLRVRYHSPEGWIAYSPELPLDFRERDRIRWTRGDSGEAAPRD